MIAKPHAVLGLVAMLALVLPGKALAEDYGFSILRAELRPDESGKEYLMDADIDFRFSEPAVDALQNGVSLGLVLHLTVKREHGWWWDATVLDEKRPFRIYYHALSKLYQIIEENGEPPRNFVSFNALIEAMGAIRRMPVLRTESLDKGEHYGANLVVGLDIEALPLPLRPVAYVTPAWHLTSAQYKWTFVN